MMKRLFLLALFTVISCVLCFQVFLTPGFGKRRRVVRQYVYKIGGEYVYQDVSGREDLRYRLSLKYNGTWSAQGLIDDKGTTLNGVYGVDANILALSHATLGLATYRIAGKKLILVGARMFPGPGEEVWVKKITYPWKKRRVRR